MKKLTTITAKRTLLPYLYEAVNNIAGYTGGDEKIKDIKENLSRYINSIDLNEMKIPGKYMSEIERKFNGIKYLKQTDQKLYADIEILRWITCILNLNYSGDVMFFINAYLVHVPYVGKYESLPEVSARLWDFITNCHARTVKQCDTKASVISGNLKEYIGKWVIVTDNDAEIDPYIGKLTHARSEHFEVEADEAEFMPAEKWKHRLFRTDEYSVHEINERDILAITKF